MKNRPVLRMNLRHAAALALVGWYLMTPPMGKYGPNEMAPLSRWEHPYTFDSARDCESALAASRKCEALGIAAVEVQHGLQDEETPLLLTIDWKCLTSDDPRLKETK
jgi:hypothetical protein